MPFKSTSTVTKTVTTTTKAFNRNGLHLQWPRRWIIFLGIILIFFCFVIAGMEVGHTISDLYRSTAFGGFILFIPLLICGLFVLLSGLKPRLLLIRIGLVLCCIMIFLCMVLIAYDILVLIDPTQCYFLSCNSATVNASNSTTIIIVSGWPLNITWPSYFQTNMNNKRIFQSIQLFAAAIFILGCLLYLVTYYFYRYVRSDQQAKYMTNNQTVINHEYNRVTPTKPVIHEINRRAPIKSASYETNGLVPLKHKAYLSPRYPERDYKVTTYTIDGQPSTLSDPALMRRRSGTFTGPHVYTSENNPLCRRCHQKPRMIFATDYERENYFPHLCINCNTELANIRQKPLQKRKRLVRRWRR